MTVTELDAAIADIPRLSVMARFARIVVRRMPQVAAE